MSTLKTADQSLMREMNTSVVMESIRLYAPLSRAELANRTGLNRSTISLIVDELINQGFVQETTHQTSKIGRPGILLQFNPDGGFAIALEIGVDFLAIIVANFIGEILWRKKQEIIQQEEQISILERAELLIEEAIAYGKELGLRPLGIGVGVPGLVEARLGKLVYAPNLKWDDVPLRLIFTRRFELPVFVENEANCAAIGEHFFGLAKNTRDFIYLNTGVGLGGGIMIGGKLIRGSTGFAGEIGHTTLYGGGELCGCGRSGCWETYVRPSRLVREVVDRLNQGEKSIIPSLVDGNLDKITVDTIVQAAGQNDVLAMNALSILGGHFAAGISNLVNIFNPEMVVIGGALSQTGPWIVPVISQALKTEILPPLRSDIHVEVSAQGADACLLGAISLVLDDIL